MVAEAGEAGRVTVLGAPGHPSRDSDVLREVLDQPVRQRQEAALHEAGHATVAARLGARVLRVTASPTFATNGRCYWAGSWEPTLREEITVTLAGDVAVLTGIQEGILTLKPEPRGSIRSRVKRNRKRGAVREALAREAGEEPPTSDRRHVERLLAELEPDEGARPLTKAELTLDAMWHVRSSWGRLLALAAELLRRELVEGDRVHEILEAEMYDDVPEFDWLSDTNGKDDAGLHRSELDEAVRPALTFNQSGTWLGHEREAWLRHTGLLSDDELED